ncbi:MAG: signal peptidase I [Alphaproteobacteria bacterium]|nr:signal peptidase I [Alphaproteobacteria bacterium]
MSKQENSNKKSEKKNEEKVSCQYQYIVKKYWNKFFGSISPNEQTKKEEPTLKEDLRFIAIFISIFALFRFFVYDYYIIPSSSMVPSLLIGDMPLVEKWTYGYSRHSIWFSPNLFSGRKFFKHNVKRGEVIVFKEPEDGDKNIIKRVIGLPGDTVAVKQGIIHVNGVPAQLKFKKRFIYEDINMRTFNELVVYDEILPLSSAPVHTVAYYEPARNSAPNNFDEIEVPEGYYFVMGDNRDFSKDSRCGLGMVPEENLMGRAVYTIYSIANGVKLWEFWLWFQNIRYDRIMKKII